MAQLWCGSAVVWFVPVFPAFWRVSPEEKEFKVSKQKNLVNSGPAWAIFEFQVSQGTQRDSVLKPTNFPPDIENLKTV